MLDIRVPFDTAARGFSRDSGPRGGEETGPALGTMNVAAEPSVCPELALIRRAQNGEEEAFRQIVERNQAKVLSIIHCILRNCNDAQDVAQQVFTKIYLSLGQFYFRSVLLTWISRIAINECYDYLRKRKVRRLTYESDLSPADLRQMNNREDGGRNPAEAVDRSIELRECAVRLLDELSEEERNLLIWKEVEGYPVKELARMVAMNVNTVRVKLFRAKVKAAKKAGVARARLKPARLSPPAALDEQFYPDALEVLN